jgi:hypothetical protein
MTISLRGLVLHYEAVTRKYVFIYLFIYLFTH